MPRRGAGHPPEALARLVDAATAADPAARLPDLEKVVAALDAILARPTTPDQRLREVLLARISRLWVEPIRGRALSACAEAPLSVVAGEARHSPRIRAGALVYASIAALRAGDTRAEVAHAAEARSHPGVAEAAHAAEIRARICAGEVPGPGLSAGEGRMVEWDELVQLARVEHRIACGLDARAAARAAADRLRPRAATLADPVWRNRYLSRPHLVAATLRLAEG